MKVCCDVCSGWFHLKCMGMKEGAGLTKEKEFVCHFCVGSEEMSGLKDRHMRTRKVRMASLECRCHGLLYPPIFYPPG